jgi:NHL repeat
MDWTMMTRRRTLACGVAVSLVAAGCGGAPHATSDGTPPTLASSGPTSIASVPNPFTITARYSASSLGLKNPRDLAIGPDGNLYVTDATDRVTIVSPGGKVIGRWGGPGNGLGQFTFVTKDPSDPRDLAASIAVGPDGKVYVSDSGNDRVEVFSASGSFIGQFGSDYMRSGQFLLPYDLAVDSNGDVYVADLGRKVLEKYSPTGAFEWAVGSGNGSTDQDLFGEAHLANVDPHGRVLGAVVDSHRIVYIDSRGHEVDTFDTLGLFKNDWGPCNVTVDTQGFTVVQSCPDAGHPVPGVPSYQATLLFDRTHCLVGAWYASPFFDFGTVRSGPNGEAFAFGATGHSIVGAILKVRVVLPGA